MPSPFTDPGALVSAAVARSLDLASAWFAWDGRPLVTDGDNLWTPHKALRRITDHLIDHLAEVEALLAGAPTIPDGWHGRMVTLDGDWARFTELDLAEARQRLTRLGQCYELRYASCPDEWDSPRTPNWTLREIAVHVAGVVWYAEQVGRPG
jgi:hypothetical protein